MSPTSPLVTKNNETIKIMTKKWIKPLAQWEKKSPCLAPTNFDKTLPHLRQAYGMVQNRPQNPVEKNNGKKTHPLSLVTHL